MNFKETLIGNGLGAMINDEYGKWGHFTKEAADIIRQAVDLEFIVSNKFTRETLAAAVAVTVMNESTFNLQQIPNVNKDPANWFRFDIGWGQLNIGWTMRMVWHGEIDSKGLAFVDVFGKPPYAADQPFSGDIITHTRLLIRRLLALRKPPVNSGLQFADQLELQVTCYTNIKSQPHRQLSWRKYRTLFEGFFQMYTTH